VSESRLHGPGRDEHMPVNRDDDLPAHRSDVLPAGHGEEERTSSSPMGPEAKLSSNWEWKAAQVISAKQMRRGVGWLALLLRVLTGVGYCVLGGGRGGFLDSISESYYTLMRDVFVGTLCMDAFFLYAYRGYNAFEDRLFNILGGFCVVIALFSMNSKEGTPGVDQDPLPACYYAIQVAPTCLVMVNNRVAMCHREWFGWVHIGAATILFVGLGYVSFSLFTRTAQGTKRTPRKVIRDRIYRVCGAVIWTSLALYLVLTLAKVLETWPLLFFAEAICLFAFGASWLVKGDGVFGLADSPDHVAPESG
jgi:hypothetical protein